MGSHVQFLGATLLTLALVDIGRRWGGAYPSPLSPATDSRREGLEIVVLYVLTVGTVTYGILVARDVIAFNPTVRFLDRRFPLYFFLSTATMVVIPISLEVGVRDRSLHDLGIRSPVAWRPTLLLVAVLVIELLAFEFSAILGLPVGLLAGLAVFVGLWTSLAELPPGIRRAASVYATFGLALVALLGLRYVNIGRDLLSIEVMVSVGIVAAIVVYILLLTVDSDPTP